MFADILAMLERLSTPTRQTLQDLFARASARRAERRRFVETLRQILELRVSMCPLLLLRVDRRLTPR
jgi:hypothetical protein